MEIRSHAASQVVGPSPAEGRAHHSLSLPHLTRRLRAERKQWVLDLGPARGENVRFFSGFGCGVYIADFHETLRSIALPPDAGSARLESACTRSLAYAPELRFDLVLAWDLCNYLSEAEILSLFQRLAPRLEPGALLFALIWTRRAIPERPMAYRILDQETLFYEALSTGQRPAPRYREPHLSRALPAFSVETSYLLRNGVQEYLFNFVPEDGRGEGPESAAVGG